MLDERRRGPRARVAGAKVVCETASGGRIAGRLLDLGKGGLFVQTERRLVVGSRLSLEIQIPGELSSWPALGRVIWAREAASDGGKPAGAGVSFIDVDDAVRVAIERVLARHPHVAGTPPAAPPRERTVLGVGAAAQAPVKAAPIVSVAPARERTVQGLAPAKSASPAAAHDLPPVREEQKTRDLGELQFDADGLPMLPPEPAESSPEPMDSGPSVEPPEPAPHPAIVWPAELAGATEGLAPDAEKSVAIDLVALKAREVSRPPARVQVRAPVVAREDSLARKAGLPRRRGGARWVLLLVVAAVAGAYGGRGWLGPRVAPYVAEALALVQPPVPAPAASARPAAPVSAPIAPAAASVRAASSASSPALSPAGATPLPARPVTAGRDVDASAAAPKPPPRRTPPPAPKAPSAAPDTAAPPPEPSGDNPY